MATDNIRTYAEHYIKEYELHTCKKNWIFYLNGIVYACVFEVDINKKIIIHKLLEKNIWDRKEKLIKIKEKYEIENY